MPVRLDTLEQRTTAISSGPPDAIPAAVLVLLVPLDDDPDPDAGVVLIRRADRGGHHSGDIALPGGRAEASDLEASDTALREAQEEIALDAVAANVRVVGELETFWIPISGYRVTPVLAIAGRRPALRAAPDEVEDILVAPLAAFLPDAPIELVESTVRDFRLRFGAYPVSGLRIWGATARILGQLGAVVAAGDPEETRASD